MRTNKSVLGVLGMCWVDFANPTQVEASNGAALRGVCWVCWVWRRARACALNIDQQKGACFFSYARPEKPNTPNTLNTEALKTLICKGFRCVGFVLGMAVLCWVWILAGVKP